MSTTLCNVCFPGWEAVEVLTVPAINPCERCGSTGPRNVFRDSVVPALRPHQFRLVEEKAQLDDRLAKLAAFLESQTFKCLDSAEQARLRCQHALMTSLSEVLAERIAAFGAPA